MYRPRFNVVFGNERIITPSGLSIIGAMLGKSDFIKFCNHIPVDLESEKFSLQKIHKKR